MAQLNPNFEIDYSDINSYEQIQLLNDAQQAKENLLMHRAYKEPSDDEVIRNRFSSFTFVDFCPKIYTSTRASSSSTLFQQQQQTGESGSQCDTSRYFQLEKFSALFERINNWLKLNKDWRICSMQTLIYDCSSKFNHLKSSLYGQYLPRNTRGLRLYLTPSKSKFSGPQKIGCINVVPRRVSGSHAPGGQPVRYETVDQILHRLNELLLTKTIEGRILSVDTITLPLIKGYVDTECNYVADERLNGLYQAIYCNPIIGGGDQQPAQDALPARAEHLIDILRVYYEFGPVTCGLVNLIDFVPRFYAPTPTDTIVEGQQVEPASGGGAALLLEPTGDQAATDDCPTQKSALAAESMTRLIRRSLAWFEAERKAILSHQIPERADGDDADSSSGQPVKINLKLCNLQVLQKTVMRRELLRIKGPNAIDILDTRSMDHRPRRLQASGLAGERCDLCRSPDDTAAATAAASPEADRWCAHLLSQARPLDVKFVRLAYVIPLQARPTCCIQAPERWRLGSAASRTSRPESPVVVGSVIDSSSYLQTAAAEQQQQQLSSNSCTSSGASSDADEDAAAGSSCCSGSDLATTPGTQANPLAQSSLNILKATTERHLANERLNQSRDLDDQLNNSPVGQLTYRLFAPCQLVISSSCFSINPVNSSSPLSRRGSVNLSGGGGGGSDSSSQQQQQPSSEQSSGSLQESAKTQAGGRLYELANQLAVPEVLKGGPSSSGSAGAGSHLVSESEQVEAIRRRMEVYVTTNLMKVVAGETIVVNLPKALSCLSFALEQTVVESQHLRCEPSTWISVNLLYVGVGEPQLPQQLLAHQKIRQLITNKSLADNPTEEEVDCLFDNDFNGCLKQDSPPPPQDESEEAGAGSGRRNTFTCNAAYERTVALPSDPQARAGDGDDDADDSRSFDHSLLAELVRNSMATPRSPVGGGELGKRKSAERRRRRSECSLM